MTKTMDERELFTHGFTADGDAVWDATKRALTTFDLRDADDTARTARFTTGVSLTSWGENMVAEVATDGTLTVRGRPKGSFLTTAWGEDVHARGVQKQLVDAISDQLQA